MKFWTNPDVRFPLVLLVASVAMWAPRLRGPIDLRYDAGVYYVLGTSIAEGRGYRLLNEPGEIRAIQYPPALALLVAGEQKLLGTHDPEVVGRALRWTYFAIFLVYSQAIYLLARRLLRPWFAFACALICTLSCDLLYLSDLLQAELPFAALTVLFALSIGGLSPTAPKHGVGRFIFSSVLGCAAFLMRSAGVALLAAWVGEAALRRQWKQFALRSVVAAVPFFAWQGWVAHVRSSPEYASPTYAYQRAPYQYYNVSYAENILLVDSFKPELGRAGKRKLGQRVFSNALTMPMCVGDAVSLSKTFGYWAIHSIDERIGRPPDRPIIPWETVDYMLLFFGYTAIAGMAMLAWQRRWFVPLYLGASVALICLTPWPQQFQRYLSPAAPFLVMSMAYALSVVRDVVHKRSQSVVVRRLATGFVAFAIGLIPVMETIGNAFVFTIRHSPMVPGENKLFYIAADWTAWRQAAEWVDANASSDDVIATSAPHLLYLRTGHKAVLPPMESNADHALSLLDDVPVRFLIVGDFRFVDIEQRYVGPMLRKFPDAWEVVYTTPDGTARVYERKRKPTAPALGVGSLSSHSASGSLQLIFVTP